LKKSRNPTVSSQLYCAVLARQDERRGEDDDSSPLYLFSLFFLPLTWPLERERKRERERERERKKESRDI
jgi:hypothetical protein